MTKKWLKTIEKTIEKLETWNGVWLKTSRSVIAVVQFTQNQTEIINFIIFNLFIFHSKDNPFQLSYSASTFIFKSVLPFT